MAYWITTILVMIALGVYAFYMRHPTVASILNGKITLPEGDRVGIDLKWMLAFCYITSYRDATPYM